MRRMPSIGARRGVHPVGDGRRSLVFRPDIQGLRAVAVALVLLDHAGVAVLSGGYIGVDVFFVISGFLITSHLIAQLREKGRIEFAAFYASRARRILPASLAVIALTAFAAMVLVSPLRVGSILRDAVASALYVPNIAFAISQTDYLTGSEPSPFQHFWSLGVEEQFYLLWPVLLLALFLAARRSMRGVTYGIAAVAIVSFVGCLVMLQFSQPWAFFSLPTRAWELAVGALLAAAIRRADLVGDVVARALTWAGLAMVVGSAVLFSAETVYPGGATLVPVIGAALVIGFGRRDGHGAEWLLNRSPVQFVGKISYSLYLVHWPILVLAQERAAPGVPLSIPVGVGLVVIAVPIAWALYRFVEIPFRSRAPMTRSTVRRSLGLSLVGSVTLVAVLSGAGAAAALMPLESTRTAASAVIEPFPAGSPYVPSNLSPSLADATDDTGEIYSNGCQQDLGSAEVLTCSFGVVDSPVVVALFGDSHAGRWFPALERAADLQGFRLDTFTKSECRSQETDVMWDTSKNPTCSTWRDAVVERLNDDPPDVIVMTNHLPAHPDRDQERVRRDWEQAVVSTIDRLPSESTMVTIADTPEFPSSPVYCLASHLNSADECSVQRSTALNQTVIRAQADASRAAGAGFIDMSDYFCNRASCPAVIGSTLVYSDDHHLTATWSELLGRQLSRELARYLPSDAGSDAGSDPIGEPVPEGG